MADRPQDTNGRQHNGSTMSGERLKPSPSPEIPADPRRVVTVSVEQSLGEIPEPAPCPNCGAARQRELVLWETTTDKLLIDAGVVPGYGCTECGAKYFPSAIAIQLYDAAARETKAVGDRSGTKRFKAQAHAAREALRSTAS